MLDLQPDLIYLKFENAKWRVHDDLENGVYPLKVAGKIWNISEGTKMKAKRRGFQFVSDFGQTAHSGAGRFITGSHCRLLGGGPLLQNN